MKRVRIKRPTYDRIERLSLTGPFKTLSTRFHDDGTVTVEISEDVLEYLAQFSDDPDTAINQAFDLAAVGGTPTRKN